MFFISEKFLIKNRSNRTRKADNIHWPIGYSKVNKNRTSGASQYSIVSSDFTKAIP